MHPPPQSAGRRARTLLLGLVAGLFLAPVQAADGLEMEEVAPGNFVHWGGFAERSAENLGDNANIGFILGSRCVAVVDTGATLALGQALRQAIAARTALPVCYVILTHVHPDHIFGAAAFVGEQTRFLGHARLPRALALRGAYYRRTLERDLGAAAAGSEIVIPSELVQEERLLDLGERRLRLRAWPVAHTDNDLTVFDERTATLWTGDLLFVDHVPVVDASLIGFLKVSADLAQLPARQYVSGHGPSTLPWPQALEPQRRYLERLRSETRDALRRRRTLEQALDTVGQGEAPNWVNFQDFHRRNVSTAYTELEWED